MREVHTMSPAELNKYLAEFIRSVRRKEGEECCDLDWHWTRSRGRVQIYRDKRPKNMIANDAPFYLGTNYTRKDSSKKILVQGGTNRCKQTKHLNENDGFESKHQQRTSHQP